MSDHPRFRSRMRGYDRSQVDARLLAEKQAWVELDTRVRERDLEIGTLTKQLENTRRELRYWHDRQAFIDIELGRAREESARIIAEATERANTLEQQAQERTLKMVDRVCDEANGVMRHARHESQALAQRYHDDVELAQQRLANTSGMQRDVVLAMRAAISRFEEGMHDLELVTPSALIAKHPTPQRVPPATPQLVPPATPQRNRPAAGASTATTPTSSTAGLLTSTVDTRTKVSLGQSAAAAVVSAAKAGSQDPALETLRLMIEGSPER